MNSLKNLLIFFWTYFLSVSFASVIHLDQTSIDEIKNNETVPIFVYAYRMRNRQESNFVKSFVDFESRLQTKLKLFDVVVNVYAVDCTTEVAISAICIDNSKQDNEHTLFGYHGYNNDVTFEKKINPREKIMEKNLLKQALEFVNPMLIDGCEDVVMDEVQTDNPLVQDDELEVQWYLKRKSTCFHCPHDFKNVRVPCSKSLPIFLRERQFSMVLFHLNVDVFSRFVLDKFIEASRMSTRENMAAVACNEWPDVCEKYDINTWPQIWFFKNDKKYKEYKMSFGSSLMATSLDLLFMPTITSLLTEDDITKFSSNKNSANKQVPALTVAFFQSEMDERYKTFVTVSEVQHGLFVIATSFGKSAKQWLKNNGFDDQLPKLITFRNFDGVQSKATFQQNEMWTDASITKFLKESSAPLLKELNANTFSVINIADRFTVIAILPDGRKDEMFKTLTSISAKESFSNVQFTFVDQTKEKVLACKLLKSLRLTASRFPTIFIRSKDSIYIFDKTFDYVPKGVENFIRSAIDGSAPESVRLTNDSVTTNHRPLAFDYIKLVYHPSSDHSNDTKQMDQMEYKCSERNDNKGKFVGQKYVDEL